MAHRALAQYGGLSSVRHRANFTLFNMELSRNMVPSVAGMADAIYRNLKSRAVVQRVTTPRPCQRTGKDFIVECNNGAVFIVTVTEYNGAL